MKSEEEVVEELRNENFNIVYIPMVKIERDDRTYELIDIYKVHDKLMRGL